MPQGIETLQLNWRRLFGMGLVLASATAALWLGVGLNGATTAADMITPSLSQQLPYFFSPVKGGVYTSPFGNRSDPINGNGRFHAGVDIAAPEGSPIIVPQPGLVVFAGERSGYGNVVVIQHHPMFHTLYGHAQHILVKRGEVVASGQPIALVGQTGRATGPHVHFETILNEQYSDPLEYLAFLEQKPPVSRPEYLAAISYYSQQAGLITPTTVTTGPVRVAVQPTLPKGPQTVLVRHAVMPQAVGGPQSKGVTIPPVPVPTARPMARLGSMPHDPHALPSRRIAPLAPPPARIAAPIPLG